MDLSGAQLAYLVEKLKEVPELTKKVVALEQVFMTNADLRPQATAALLQLAEAYKEKVILSLPAPETSSGDYPIGLIHQVQDRHPFALRKPELLRHVGIYAMTGGGKSIALDAIIENLLKDDIPCILFDWDGSHRHFLSRPEGKKLNYFRPGSTEFPLPFNPNKVNEQFSVQQELSYLNALYYSLTERHFPNETLNREGVRFLLFKLAETLLRGAEADFTFSTMKQLALGNRVEFSQREQEWRITTLNFLTRLTTGPLGQVFNAKAHLSPAMLLGQQSLIDLSNLIHPIEKADFIESLLFNLYECHLKQQQPMDTPQSLRLVVVIEEIHHIGNSVLKIFFREMRKWGAGLVFTAQHPSLVDIQIRGNCYTSICQNLESPEDLEIMGKTLLLDSRKLPYLGDERSYLSRIPAGSGLYLIKMQGRFTRPFCLHISRLPAIGQEMTFDALKQRMQTIYRSFGPHNAQLGLGSANQSFPPAEEEIEKMVERLHGRAKMLLADIGVHPSGSVSQRYKRLNFTLHSGHRTKQNLLKQRLIQQEPLGRGRTRLVQLSLTELGEQVLAKLGQPIVAPPYGNLAEHEWAKSELAWYLDKVLGWQHVRTEHVIGTDPDKKLVDDFWALAPDASAERVDIHAEKNGKKIALEIETGKSHYMKNILKCLKEGYDIVVSVATNAEVKAKIKARVERLREAGVKMEGKVFVVHQGEAQDFVKGYLDVTL